MEPKNNPDSINNQVIVKRPKHRARRLFKKVLASFGVSHLLFLILLAIIPVWMGVKHSSYFALQKIEVAGDLKQTSAQEVIKAANVALGQNLFDVFLKEIEKNVLKLQWVRSVSVRRHSPETLWIHVNEQKPIALLLSDKLYFISQDGHPFKEVDKEVERDLPVITGFEKGDLLDSPLQLIHFFESNPHFDVFGLSEIHYNDATGFSIVTLSGPIEIRLGRGNFEEKLAQFQTIWSKLGPRLGRIKGIDLDYEDRVFVKL